jgi:hypothetical protein|tara:strand:+ start:246 stop:617 length:372 start_codon:yes stop_codon:yes gene_type:complete
MKHKGSINNVLIENEITIEPINEKLDDKIAKLNSSRVYKKITPKGDLSWYIKWAASFFILVAVAARSVGTIPLIDLWFSLIGTTGWFWVGMLWHDRALTMLNATLTTLLVAGLFQHYFGGVLV